VRRSLDVGRVELAVGEALANAHDHSGVPDPIEVAIAHELSRFVVTVRIG